jgi:hypothetical protein
MITNEEIESTYVVETKKAHWKVNQVEILR